MADTTTGTSVAIATPDLEIIEGQITTTSTQIAAHFNKRHDTVLRAIRNLECSDEYRLRNFAESSYLNEQGKEQPCYRLTRDGFVFLAMGFTGKDAAQWKEAYITAFNKMEQELLAKRPAAPYSVHPSQTLSAAQAKTLRELLTTQVKKLPHAKQAGAMVTGWSKLKAHFGTDYRHIPASEFHEAVSIIARHTAEWELVDDTPKVGTVQEIVADWVKKIESPNGYPAMLFEPLVEAVQRKMGNQQARPRYDDAVRTQAAFDAATQAAARVQSAVFNAVMTANDEWKHSRYLLAFIDDSAKGSPAHVRQLDRNVFITTWPRLVNDVATGEAMCTNKELLDMAYACMQRMAQRGTPARSAA